MQHRAGASGGWSTTGVTVATSQTGTGHKVQIANLTNGVTYQIQVAAPNSAGTGTPVFVEGEPVGNQSPDKPTNLTIEPGNRRLLVSWRAPSDAGGYEDSALTYRIRYRKTGGGDWTLFASSETGISVTIPDLDNGVEWEVRVEAKNPVLTGAQVTKTGTPVRLRGLRLLRCRRCRNDPEPPPPPPPLAKTAKTAIARRIRTTTAITSPLSQPALGQAHSADYYN